MLANCLAAAIEAARPSQLDQHRRDLWQAYAIGLITDEQAEELTVAIEGKRTCRHAPKHACMQKFRPRKPQLAKRHPERIARRRRLAASGPMPPQLACAWTTGEMSVLRIVADEVRANGTCDRSLAEIAARAGVCRSLAQQTLRRAATAGLIAITERPRNGAKNLTNVVRIISREWNAWLKHSSPNIGSRIIAPTDIKINYRRPKPASNTLRTANTTYLSTSSPPI